MHESLDEPEELQSRKNREHLDSRYHDDDEAVPTEDSEFGRNRPLPRRRPTRRPPPRRYVDDD